MRLLRGRYIDLDDIRKYYTGGIVYTGGMLKKRHNKDLSTELHGDGYTLFYGKKMYRDGRVESTYYYRSKDYTQNRHILSRAILKTSKIVTNRPTSVITYNGTQRHHYEALKKGKPSKIGNDGRYFIPKTLITPDGITRPVRSNVERTDRVWLETRW